MTAFRGIRQRIAEIKENDLKEKEYERMQSEKESNWKSEHPTNCQYKNTRNGCVREDFNINLVVIGHTKEGRTIGSKSV